jgi:hypothetical protein
MGNVCVLAGTETGLEGVWAGEAGLPLASACSRRLVAVRRAMAAYVGSTPFWVCWRCTERRAMSSFSNALSASGVLDPET